MPSQQGWRAVGLIALSLGIVAMALVGLFVPLPFWGRTTNAIGDMVHAPLFGGLALGTLGLLQWLRPLSPRCSSLLVRGLVLWTGLSLVGVGIEIVQERFGRSAAIHDAVSNSLGILAAILCYAWWWLGSQRLAARWLPNALLAIAAACIAVSWWRPIHVLADVVQIRRSFPLLASFESSEELSRFYFRECSATRTRLDATDGKYAMEVSFDTTEYPGATLAELHNDWTEMRTLELDVTLDSSYAGKEAQFMLKVLDRRHHDHNDTFRGQWTLHPGKTLHLSIDRAEIVDGPDTRQLDLSNIRFVDLLLLEPVGLAKVRFDNIRLKM